MRFMDFLQRYHISPLKYDDDQLLVEKDYKDFFTLLVKYHAATYGFNQTMSFLSEVGRKVDFIKRNSLLPVEETEILDLLMEQNPSPVIQEESNIE